MIISWIVPLYNCGKYIVRCIESIMCQGIGDSDYEIVIVDDGSTDDSYTKALTLQASYPQIKIIRQTNQGSGAARNAGIRASEGEYIHFVDADDMLDEGAFGRLFDTICRYSGFDIVSFSHRHFHDLSQIPYHSSCKDITIERLSIYEFCCAKGFKPNVVDFVFRRDFIISNGLKFDNFILGEDLMFMLNVYMLKDYQILSTDLIAYHYYQRAESATNHREKSSMPRRFANLCRLYTAIIRTQALAGYPSGLSERCALICAQCPAITELLSANLRLNELKPYYDAAYECGMFPIAYVPDTLARCISFFSAHRTLIGFIAPLYRSIYLPFIKRRRQGL